MNILKRIWTTATRQPATHEPSRKGVSALRVGVRRGERFDDLPHEFADGDWPHVPRRLLNEFHPAMNSAEGEQDRAA